MIWLLPSWTLLGWALQKAALLIRWDKQPFFRHCLLRGLLVNSSKIGFSGMVLVSRYRLVSWDAGYSLSSLSVERSFEGDAVCMSDGCHAESAGGGGEEVVVLPVVLHPHHQHCAAHRGGPLNKVITWFPTVLPSILLSAYLSPYFSLLFLHCALSFVKFIFFCFPTVN